MAVITVTLEDQGVHRRGASKPRAKSANPIEYVVRPRRNHGRAYTPTNARQAKRAAKLNKHIDPFYLSHTWRILRFDVIQRDKQVCFYCGDVGRQADHVIPRKEGGEDTMDNLVCSCASCNRVAGNNVFPNRDDKRVWIRKHRGVT